MLEFRYANILTVTTICFLFSPGMPILYGFAALYFFITYWTDKFLLFNCYKKPVKFDNYIATKTLSWFKWVFLAHVIQAFNMFGNTPILANTEAYEKYTRLFRSIREAIKSGETESIRSISINRMKK